MSDRIHKITSLGDDPAQQPQPQGPPRHEYPDATAQPAAPRLLRGIDRMLAIQRPIVLAHIRAIRRRNPHAAPHQLVRILERRYLAAVTTGGAAVGATAVVPGVTTGVTLALSGVETAGFLEATSLFAQSVAEVHGIAITNPERARALVMTLMLGQEGTDLVRQLASQATGTGTARSAYWGEIVTNTLPKAMMSPLVDRLKRAFIRQFAARGGASFIGKALPFGIGAAIGGTGNHILGRRVLASSRLAFGNPPPELPRELEPIGDSFSSAAGQRIRGATVTVGVSVIGAAETASRSVVSAGRQTGRAIAGATRRVIPKRRTTEPEGDVDGNRSGTQPEV